VVVNRHRDVGKVQPAMLRETISNEPLQLIVIQIVDVVDVLEISRHVSPIRGSPESARPTGWRRYRKNRYEMPSEKVRLFVQSLSPWRWFSTTDPSLAGM